jgi:hypothetical protein
MNKQNNSIISNIVDVIDMKNFPAGSHNHFPCSSKLINFTKFRHLPKFYKFDKVPEYKNNLLIRDKLDDNNVKFILYDIEKFNITDTCIVPKKFDDNNFGYFVISDKLYCYLYCRPTYKFKIFTIFPYKIIIEFDTGNGCDEIKLYYHNNYIIFGRIESKISGIYNYYIDFF